MNKFLKGLVSALLAGMIASGNANAGATFSRVTTWSSGNTLTASALNAEFNNILNNLTPAGMDDYSANTTEMRATADPYPGGAESLATSLQGEIERLRYQVLGIKQAIQATNTTYWYQDAPTSGVFAIHTTSASVTGSMTVTTMTVSSMTVSSYFGFPANSNLTHVRAELSGDQTGIGDAACQTAHCTVNVWTDVYDTGSEMGTTTFTATSTGYYRVCAVLLVSDGTSVSAEASSIWVNGVYSAALSYSGSDTGDEEVKTSGGCTTVSLTANDLLTIRMFATGATGPVLEQSVLTDVSNNYKTSLTIDRVY